MFKIKLELQNLAKKPIFNILVSLNYNLNIYKLRDRNPLLPVMLPNLTYKVDVEVECVDATGANDLIKVFVIDHHNRATVPLITANIQMPVSDLAVE